MPAGPKSLVIELRDQGHLALGRRQAVEVHEALRQIPAGLLRAARRLGGRAGLTIIVDIAHQQQVFRQRLACFVRGRFPGSSAPWARWPAGTLRSGICPLLCPAGPPAAVCSGPHPARCSTILAPWMCAAIGSQIFSRSSFPAAADCGDMPQVSRQVSIAALTGHAGPRFSRTTGPSCRTTKATFSSSTFQSNLFCQGSGARVSVISRSSGSWPRRTRRLTLLPAVPADEVRTLLHRFADRA